MQYQPTLLHLVPPLVQFLAATPVVKAQHLASVKVDTRRCSAPTIPFS